VPVLKAGDLHLCRFLADSATITYKHALEGILSHSPVISRLLARIHTMRPKAQLAATIEPGGETRMVTAEVM
jgi:hypothetical protein